MTYAVTLKPSGYTIFVEPGETVLEAALRQGYDFPYSCRSATCSTCMGKILSGSITYGHVEPYALDEQAIQEGFALFCSAHPETDLIIHVEDVFGPEVKPIRTLSYQIASHEVLANDLHRIWLNPEKPEAAIQYLAGQYIQIVCEDNSTVPFSIANAPVEGETKLELHIHESDSPRTQSILRKVASNTPLTLKGPYGKMIYHSEPHYPILFIAGGTGIVPFKAIIESLLAQGIQQEMHLYWGVQDTAHLYLHDLFAQWQKHIPHFQYTPVVGGWVHEQALKNYADLSQHQVFVSGPPKMVYAAQEECLKKGLKSYCIYSDAFDYFPKA